MLSTAEPLCLDPNPVVSIIAKKASLARQKLGTAPVRRAAKKFSQVSTEDVSVNVIMRLRSFRAVILIQGGPHKSARKDCRGLMHPMSLDALKISCCITTNIALGRRLRNMII